MTDWENVVNERLIESVLVESCGGSSRRVGWGGHWVGHSHRWVGLMGRVRIRGCGISSSVVEGQTTISCHTILDMWEGGQIK